MSTTSAPSGPSCSATQHGGRAGAREQRHVVGVGTGRDRATRVLAATGRDHGVQRERSRPSRGAVHGAGPPGRHPRGRGMTCPPPAVRPGAHPAGRLRPLGQLAQQLGHPGRLQVGHDPAGRRLTPLPLLPVAEQLGGIGRQLVHRRHPTARPGPGGPRPAAERPGSRRAGGLAGPVSRAVGLPVGLHALAHHAGRRSARRPRPRRPGCAAPAPAWARSSCAG